MGKPTIETVSAQAYPEVLAFLKAQRKLEAWRKDFPAAAARLDALAPEYNAALEAADTVVRKARVTCGPFVLAKYSAKYSAPRFAEKVSRVEFQRLGGTFTPSEVASLERARFEALIARELIEPDVADYVMGWTPTYEKPGEIALP